MRISLTGPSGSGKTTLAEFITEKYPQLKFKSNSAYNVISEAQKKELKAKYGYEGTGHRNVIRLSNINPDFGLAFQSCLLSNRILGFRDEDNIITDRCFIDNAAYLLDQCGVFQPDEVIEEYISRAALATAELIDLVIWVRVCNPKDLGIEDNGSRVNNWYYQHKMDAVFDYMINKNEQFSQCNTKVLVLNQWDLEWRKEMICNAIDNLYGIK